MERYGVENCWQSEEKKQKIRDTLIERYGVDNAQKNKEIKNQKTKKEDSSDDSLDDEDTGETSGQELVSERNERKRKVENGKYKTARPDITTKADKRVTNLIKTIAAEEAQMGIKTDENQKMLQTCLVTAIQRQTYNDSQINTVFYPKIKLTKNNERLYDPT